MPIGHGPKRFFFLRLVSFSLDAVLPLSVAYLAWFFYNEQAISSPFSFLPTLLFQYFLPIYSLAEIFFFFYYCLQVIKFQNAKDVEPMSFDMRFSLTISFFSQKYIKKIFGEYEGSDFLRFLTGWFLWEESKEQLMIEDFQELRRDNIKEWY
jgi:hypothetical protein